MVKNNDELCLLRAIVIAELFESRSTKARNLYQYQNSKKFQNLVHELCIKTYIWKGPCGIKEIKQIEKKLTSIKLWF